jgi:hypothetical protein
MREAMLSMEAVSNQREHSGKEREGVDLSKASQELHNAGIALKYAPLRAPALIQGGGGNPSPEKAKAREKLWSKAA